MVGTPGRQGAGDVGGRVDTEAGNPNKALDERRGRCGAGFKLKDVNEKLFRLVSQILHSMEKLQLIIRLLSILEFLQILFFVISKHLPNMWNANVFTYLQTITDYVNLDRVLMEGTSSAINSLILTIFSVHCTGVVLFVLMVWFTPVHGILPEVLNFFIKVFTLYLFALRAVLVVPSAQVAYVGFVCDPSSVYTSGRLNSSRLGLFGFRPQSHQSTTFNFHFDTVGTADYWHGSLHDRFEPAQFLAISFI